jgi:hypothetical protein
VVVVVGAAVVVGAGTVVVTTDVVVATVSFVELHDATNTPTTAVAMKRRSATGRAIR